MPRPATEWLFDDLGRMDFALAYDFTSGEFRGPHIGVVFAFTTAPDEPQDGERRFQLMMRPETAAALHEALGEHLANLRQ